jgi:DNA adenine methylase
MLSAKPLLRWIGGKQRLVTRLARFAPPEAMDSRTYFEPFLGGASLCLNLQPTNAVVGDENVDLIGLYRSVVASPKRLAGIVSTIGPLRSEKTYFAARNEYQTSPPSLRKAALFLLLNRACFNGVWRVSRAGKFNVPYGRLREQHVPSVNHLLAVAQVLRNAELVAGDFEESLRGASRGDFCYLDPPYPPLNATAFFAHYGSARFGWDDHRRLAATAQRLKRRGVRVMISISDSPEIRDLYSNWRFEALPTTRYVGASGRRYRVEDLLILSYA